MRLVRVGAVGSEIPGALLDDDTFVDLSDVVDDFNEAFFASCHRALKDDGILVQQSESPLVLLDLIKEMRAEMGKAGFASFQTLPFPQPCYPTGYWSCTIASKTARDLSAFREGDASSKPFATQYYNVGIHSGALMQPEFMREALGD